MKKIYPNVKNWFSNVKALIFWGMILTIIFVSMVTVGFPSRSSQNQGMQESQATQSPNPILESLNAAIVEIKNSQVSVTEPCGILNPVSGQTDWMEYRNNNYQYAFQYPTTLFEIREYNECSLIELIPSTPIDTPNYSSIYEYYVSFIAVKTPNTLEADDFLSYQLQDLLKFPDISQQIKERQFTLDESIATEWGPIPGQVGKNVVAIPLSEYLLQIEMYPAPFQPGELTLPADGFWHGSQEAFPSIFYQILQTLRLDY